MFENLSDIKGGAMVNPLEFILVRLGAQIKRFGKFVESIFAWPVLSPATDLVPSLSITVESSLESIWSRA